MLSQLLQITHSGLAYMVIGGFAVGFTMVALLVKQKLYINEVVLGTAVGVVFGPLCANLFDPRAWGGDVNAVTLEVTRIALAAGLFTIGVELPNAFLAKHARGLLVMVVPTMAIGWVVVAAVIFLLFPRLDIVSALVIAACLTPTDPIISAAIIGGKFAAKRVPQDLRWIIAAESAANDGLAYPFLSLSIFLTLEPTVGSAFTKWVLIGCLYQVAFGTLIGVGIGLGFSRLMRLSQSRGFIDSESYVAQYLALTLFTIGVARTLGSDDLLAAFAAGSALNWDGHFDLNTQTEGRVFSAVIDLILNCGTFVYIGAWMPFAAFSTPALGVTPWRLALLLVAVLALRRIPALLVLYRWVPEIKSWKEALFAGHFGPMGVGAVFISTFALTELPKPHTPPQGQAETLAAVIQVIVAFVVLGSIVVHGLSIALFSFGARTRTLTRTWTSRTRSRNGAAQPEWLLSVRRHPSVDMHGARNSVSGSVSDSGDGKDSHLAPDVEASAGRVAVQEQNPATRPPPASASTPAAIAVLPPAPPPAVVADAARAHLRGQAGGVDRALAASVNSRDGAHSRESIKPPESRSGV